MPFLNRFGESIKLRYLQKSNRGKIFLSRQDLCRVITWQKLTRGRLYCKINNIMPPDFTIISVCFTYIYFSFFQSRLYQKGCQKKRTLCKESSGKKTVRMYLLSRHYPKTNFPRKDQIFKVLLKQPQRESCSRFDGSFSEATMQELTKL